MNRTIRKAEEYLFKGLMIIATYGIAIILFIIIFSIVYRGLPAISWEMISQTPKGGFFFGREGGILNAIVGSIFLGIGSTSLAFLIGVPVALFMNVHLRKRQKFVNGIRFLLDLLWGVPAIVYGAFGFTLMVFFGLNTSLLAGIIVITLFILPVMIRSVDEVLKTVSKGLMEASLSLGSTESETAYRVFFKQSIPGVITAILLSFGRAIGDAASVLFTTGFTDLIPTSLTQPTASLPLAIFFQLGSPIPEVKERAFAAALILTIIVLFISILSRLLTRHFQKNKLKFE